MTTVGEMLIVAVHVDDTVLAAKSYKPRVEVKDGLAC